MAGLLASISTILPSSAPGLRQRLAAASGDMVALPATALTCSWLQVTHLTLAGIGWAAKQLFACRLGRLGLVSPPTTGHRPTGSILTKKTPTWAVSVPQWSMCLELCLPSLCLRWAKMAMPILSIGTTLAALLPLWPKRPCQECGLTEGHQLSLTTPAREHILDSMTTTLQSRRTELRRQVRLRSNSPGASIRTAAARPGSQRLTA